MLDSRRCFRPHQPWAPLLVSRERLVAVAASVHDGRRSVVAFLLYADIVRP